MVNPTSDNNDQVVLAFPIKARRAVPALVDLAHMERVLRDHIRLTLFEGKRQAWWPVVQHWLGQFDGLDTMLVQISDLPASQVLDVLGARLGDADPLIAESLACCDFLCWRAHPINEQLERRGAAWDWRKESLLAFQAAAPYVMYQTDTEHPHPVHTASWLLARLTGRPHLGTLP